MKSPLNLILKAIQAPTFSFQLFCIFLIHSFSFAQDNCKATLEVSKNRNSRSSTTNGTYFKLTLTNESVTSDTYDLTYINNSNTCSSGTEDQIGNVNLNIQFENLNFNSLSKISLQPYESIEFYAHIIIPIGTPINKWCCSEIIATSNNCSSYKTFTDIHTLVITTSNE
jgi:hypothetical protein